MFSSKKEYIGHANEKELEEFIDYKSASPELLEEIRTKLKKEKKASLRLSIFLFLFLVIVALWFTFYLFGNDTKIEKSRQIVKNEVFQDSISKIIIFYIEDGDEWLNQGKFENALFQYKKALELDSTNLSVEYRVCLAYSYLCRYDNLMCHEGDAHLKSVIEKFPNEDKLLEFKKFY